MLERTGLVEHVDTLLDGQSAIEYLQQCCANTSDASPSIPDLILLDLDMPVVNGYDVLEALQKSPNCEWLIVDRIIVLTSSINPKDMERTSAYDIYDFLVKPLTETKLMMELERFLSRHKNGAIPDQQLENSSQHIAGGAAIDTTPVANTTAGEKKDEQV